MSPVICKLFEMLILPIVRNCCQMPNYQFGFTVGLGCADALFALAAILSDSEATGDPVVISSFDVNRAFDSSVHAQILLEAYKQGLNLCIVRVVYYMYNNLRAQIKIPSSPAESVVVPVRKGVRQGSVVSPTLYNNSVLPAQAQVATSCVSKGIDVSLITYADDLLNLNRSADRLSKNFDVLSRAYNKIGLSFNVSKSAILFFNARYYEKEIPLGDSAVKPCDSITYLGLPIGRSLYSTGTLLVRHVEAKIRIA